jgi:mRNA interferase RelE/StbE
MEGHLPTCKVHVSKSARREIKKLTRQAQIQVVEALDKLAAMPLPPGVEKLQSNPGFFRVRSGDFRIIYALLSTPSHLVVVLVVRDRKDAFKGLEKLDQKLASALVEVAGTLLEQTATQGTA